MLEINRRFLAAAFAAILLAAPLPAPVGAGEFDVVLNEINYHPLGEQPGDEFLELHNQGTTPVDLSGWRLAKGVQYVFPEGAVLPAGGFLVVSPDRDRTAARYGLPKNQVFGNYTGRLSRSGEVLRLENAAGRTISSVHYRDGGAWPELADGLGPSLELSSILFDLDLPEAWSASLAAGGTPGAPNSTLRRPVEPRPVIGPNEEWRYFKGTAEPAAGGGLGWAAEDFDEASWLSGPAPFGYGLPDPLTTLADMQASYTTLYLRQRFDLDGAAFQALQDGTGRLELVVGYDDAFLLLVNGVELARLNAPGQPGESIPFNAVSLSPQNSVQAIDLGGAEGPLRPGSNLIAIQGVNAGLGNRDFLLAVSLQQVPRAAAGSPPEKRLWINEARPTAEGSPGFIELYNSGAVAADLGGHALRDSSDRPPYLFPAGSSLPPRSFLTVRDAELGFPVEGVRTVFLLLAADGKTIIDALESEPGASNRSTGRHPDGTDSTWAMEAPTENAPNVVLPETRIAINEIHYHPQSEDAADEFIELFNRSSEPVSLAGWRFSKGIGFQFPLDAVVPGNGYLVVAQDAAAFEARHGLQNVAGGHQDILQNDEEEIVLRDALGNPADRVHYADDDAWPAAADGGGPSLELLNPALDNRYGRAWRAGPAGGTPGAANQSFQDDPVPEAVAVRHFPPVPGPGDAVTVRCRVLDTEPPARVTLDYQNDTQGGSGSIELRDDGQAGDDLAGDGIYQAAIPPAPEGSLLRFHITCRDPSGDQRAVPAANQDFLYEVHKNPAAPEGLESYLILLTEDNWRDLNNRGARSDVLLDGAFIDLKTGEIFYNAGVRFRGMGSRNPPDGRHNYRVQFSDDRKYHGLKRLNINSQNTHRQLLGNDFFRRAGLPYPQSLPANLRIHRQDDGHYLRVEAYDEEFLERFFGGDDGGNLYRGMDDGSDLRYLGEGFGPYRGSYEKITNEEAADYSDLVGLTKALTQTSDAEYAAAVEAWVDVEEWVLYFAANSAIGNNENSILLSAGDDYFIYRRPSDGRFVIIPWDSDSLFVDDDQVLFRPASPAVSRLLKHPRYAPLYYCDLLDLAAGPLSPVNMAERLERAAALFPAQAIASIENFVNLRQAYLDAAISREVTIGAVGQSDTKIGLGEAWSFFRGKSAPSADPLGWTALDFDDAAWETGPSGFGYGDNDDATVLGDMQNGYSTVFIRKRFDMANPQAVLRLILEINYDDGFVAYLNGSEVARRQFNDAVPAFDKLAAGGHEIANPPESIDISSGVGFLQPGANVLAIVGFNNTLDSSDFSLAPALQTEFANSGLGCGTELFTGGEALTVSGTAPACGTARVTVNGVEAVYTPWQARWRADVALAPGANAIEVQVLDGAGEEIGRREIAIQAGAALAALPAQVDGLLDLDAAGGPYILSGLLTVAAGAKLRIGPGAVILAGTEGGLEVRGEIEALGTAEKPILFRRLKCGEGWRGISITGAGPAAAPAARLSHCDFRFPGEVAGGTLLRVKSAGAELEGCQFGGVSGTAVEATDASLALADCAFTDCGTAARCANSAASIRGTWFEAMDRQGVVLSGAGAPPAEVEGCSFRGGLGIGLEADGVQAAVRECLFSGCPTGLSQKGGSLRLEMAVVEGCLTGAWIQSGADFQGDHVTAAGNFTFLEVSGAAGARSQAGLENSIVWGNRHIAAVGADASVAAAYSCVESDPVLPGEGNINADPLFADFAHGDYRLQPASPARGSGRGGADMGAFLSAEKPVLFIRGDCDRDGELAITDAVKNLIHLFLGGGDPPCEDACDADDTGDLTVTDAIYLLNFLFLGGDPIPAPHPQPGADTTADNLTCKN